MSAAGFFILGVVWLIGFMCTLAFMVVESFELDNYIDLNGKLHESSFTPFVTTDILGSIFWPIFWPLYGIYLIRKHVS